MGAIARTLGGLALLLVSLAAVGVGGLLLWILPEAWPVSLTLILGGWVAALRVSSGWGWP